MSFEIKDNKLPDSRGGLGYVMLIYTPDGANKSTWFRDKWPITGVRAWEIVGGSATNTTGKVCIFRFWCSPDTPKTVDVDEAFYDLPISVILGPTSIPLDGCVYWPLDELSAEFVPETPIEEIFKSGEGAM
jgi:hypothetical protein